MDEGGVSQQIMQEDPMKSDLLTVIHLFVSITISDVFLWSIFMTKDSWDVSYPKFLFHPSSETILLSKSLISRIFLKPNWFWFQYHVSCPMCSRVSCASCPACLKYYVLLFLTCFVSCVLLCLTCLVLCVFSCLTSIVPHLLWCFINPFSLRTLSASYLKYSMC